MRDQDLGALPVGDGSRLIGMVTDRDIVMRAVAADRGGGTTAVREVIRRLPFLSESVWCRVGTWV
jgi:CBS domain-containing protein